MGIQFCIETFTSFFISFLLFAESKKRRKSYIKDLNSFPNKYKLLDDRYQDDIVIENISYTKVDVFSNDRNYVILQKDQINYVALYDLESDELSISDEETTNTIIRNYLLTIKDESFYRGTLLGNFLINITSFLLVFVSLGLLIPYVVCRKHRYINSNTFICGEKLVFKGKTMELFGHFILWWFLTIITLGIYTIWLSIAIKKWTVKNTHFVKVNQGISIFIGTTFGYVFRKIVYFLINLLTVGIASPWTYCAMQRYITRHTIIDGVELKFDGYGMQYFGKRILWFFLTLITLGIYSLWLSLKSKKWIVKHTVFDNLEKKSNIIGIFKTSI